MLNLSYDDKQRIAAIIILAISFSFHCLFLELFLVFIVAAKFADRFQNWCWISYCRTVLIYIPAIAYLTITK